MIVEHAHFITCLTFLKFLQKHPVLTRFSIAATMWPQSRGRKMPKKIGVRELKNQTSSIVREVREEAAEYVITHHGQPVALLRPIGKQDMEDLQKQEAVATWENLLEAGRQLSESKQIKKSVLETLEEIREEEN